MPNDETRELVQLLRARPDALCAGAADEIERLQLYANLAEEFGLSAFADLSLKRCALAAPKLLANLSALVARYEYDGIPNDSLPTWNAARELVEHLTEQRKAVA